MELERCFINKHIKIDGPDCKKPCLSEYSLDDDLDSHEVNQCNKVNNEYEKLKEIYDIIFSNDTKHEVDRVERKVNKKGITEKDIIDALRVIQNLMSIKIKERMDELETISNDNKSKLITENINIFTRSIDNHRKAYTDLLKNIDKALDSYTNSGLDNFYTLTTLISVVRESLTKMIMFNNDTRKLVALINTTSNNPIYKQKVEDVTSSIKTFFSTGVKRRASRKRKSRASRKRKACASRKRKACASRKRKARA